MHAALEGDGPCLWRKRGELLRESLSKRRISTNIPAIVMDEAHARVFPQHPTRGNVVHPAQESRPYGTCWEFGYHRPSPPPSINRGYWERGTTNAGESTRLGMSMLRGGIPRWIRSSPFSKDATLFPHE